ncbi:MAG TPA: hypothetical protein VGM05_24320 [Planctomycetaceae bacterium]|jgi:Spy/CpxP family protein refolding chaperone
MNSFFKSVCALTMLALGAAPLWAADKMVAEEGAVEVLLLRQQTIQKELKLTPDEIEKIHDHGEMQWEKAQSAHVLGAAERNRKFAEMTRENEKFVKETLTKEQHKRLHQITLQMAGLLCVTRPEIASKLNLTADQKKQAHELQKEARRDAEEVIHSTKKAERHEKLRELHKTSLKSINELLTDEQEAIWSEMIGPPFKGDLFFFEPDEK